MTLPTNIDATYADSGTDASVQLHQQYHDTIHAAVNVLPGLANKPTASAVPAESSLTVVSTFQSGHGWAATTADATTNLNNTTAPVVGSQYASVVSQGLGTGTPARLTKTGLTLDLTGKQIRLLVRVTNASALDNLQFFAGNSGFASYYIWQLARYADATVQAYTREGVWTWVTFGFEGGVANGTPAKNALTDLRLTVIDNGTAKVTVDVAAVAIAPDPSSLAWPQGVISFTCDDGWASQYTAAKPILDRYLYPSTAFVISDAVDGTSSLGLEGSMTLTQLQQLRSVNGWEIGSHAHTLANHNAGFSSLSTAALDTELESAKQWIRDNGLGNGDHLAYPLGDYNATVLDRSKKYFTSARTVHDFYRAETVPPGDRHRLRVMQLNSGITLASAEAAVDACLANGDWLIVVFHRLDTVADSKTWVTSDFSTLVDYIATKGIPVRTLGAVLNGRNEEGVRNGGGKVLAATYPTVSPGIVNTVTESVLASLTVPAKHVKAGDVLTFDLGWDFLNNSGAAVTYLYRLKVGATTVGSTGAISVGTSTQRGGGRGRFYIALPELNTPRVWGDFTASFAGASFAGLNASHSGGLQPQEPAVDFSADVVVQLTCTMGTASANADFRLHAATLTRERSLA